MVRDLNSNTGALWTPLWEAAATSMSHSTTCSQKQALIAEEVNVGSESFMPSALISTLQLSICVC